MLNARGAAVGIGTFRGARWATTPCGLSLRFADLGSLSAFALAGDCSPGAAGAATDLAISPWPAMKLMAAKIAMSRPKVTGMSFLRQMPPNLSNFFGRQS
ncbi:MAG TPA: hypothetical protein VMF12_18580 [Xanthobacteraceae bacterium]|nr:hypothetical protein [Xanthobacteraceae bacterium]